MNERVRPDFRIARHVDDHMLATLRDMQATVAGSSPGFVKMERPHLTIVGTKTIARRVRTMEQSEMEALMFPLPGSAIEPLTLGVNGLRFIQGRREKAYLTISLSDPRDEYRNEYLAIDSRVRDGLGFRKRDPHQVHPPHVSIGRAFPSDVATSVLGQVEDALPKTMTFLPVSYPSTDVPPSERYVDARSAPPIPAEYRRIPTSFLQSLRPDTSRIDT